MVRPTEDLTNTFGNRLLLAELTTQPVYRMSAILWRKKVTRLLSDALYIRLKSIDPSNLRGRRANVVMILVSEAAPVFCYA
jgi:hypothetical protein